MKTKLLAFIFTVSALSMANAATIAINGTYAFNAVANSGGNLASNSLAFVIVDTGSNGFLTSTITQGDSLAVGSFLSGDDLIVGRFGALNTTNANLDTLLQGNVSFDVDTGVTAPANPGQNFALVWFDRATTSTNNAALGQFYQFGRGTDWVLPSAPTTKTMGTDFTQLGTSAGASAGQTTIAVAGVPEPSRVLLSMIGLSFLATRRRRRLVVVC